MMEDVVAGDKMLKTISDIFDKVKKESKERYKNKYIYSLSELTEYEEFTLTDLYLWLTVTNNELHMIAPSFIKSGVCRFIVNGKLFTLGEGDSFDVEEYILPFKFLYVDIDDYEELEWGNYAYDFNTRRVINLWTGKPCIIMDDE